MSLRRPAGAEPGSLVAVDATSAAGGLRWSPDEVDVYYFAPQKCLASDGGLWLALLLAGRAGAHRAHRRRRAAGSRRRSTWRSPSRTPGSNQTLNTPALATLFLADWQVRWLNEQGGLDWAAKRCDTSAETIYGWAEASPYATPFVADPAQRSSVVATIDLDERHRRRSVAKVLRANGIVDTESYRKLGRNQLRVALFPAIDPADVEALTRCIDHVVAALS